MMGVYVHELGGGGLHALDRQQLRRRVELSLGPIHAAHP